MKKIAMFLFLALLSVSILNGQASKTKNNPVGNWKFDAPYAPEGYTSGVIEVVFADNKYSSNISFTGSDYKIPGEKVKFENDTIDFVVYIEGNDIAIKLKMESSTRMSGKATYFEGEIPLTLLREVTGQ